MKFWRWSIFLTLTAVIMYYIYIEYRVPLGMQPMGESDEIVARIGLYAAIISAAGAFFGFLKDLISLIKKSGER